MRIDVEWSRAPHVTPLSAGPSGALASASVVGLAACLLLAAPASSDAQVDDGTAGAPEADAGAPAEAEADRAVSGGEAETRGGEPLLGEGPGDDSERIVVQDEMEGEAMPAAPQGVTGELETPTRVTVNAGLGSEVAYARQSVVELGGGLSLVHRSETTTISILPQAGYFIVDNVELSVFPELSIVHVEDSTDVRVGAVFEPSYHLPIADRIFIFAGLGLGLSYQEEPGVEFLLRPRIGLDGLVGRSGIFKPALFLDIGFDDGAYAGGVEAGFTVLL